MRPSHLAQPRGKHQPTYRSIGQRWEEFPPSHLPGMIYNLCKIRELILTSTASPTSRPGPGTNSDISHSISASFSCRRRAGSSPAFRQRTHRHTHCRPRIKVGSHNEKLRVAVLILARQHRAPRDPSFEMRGCRIARNLAGTRSVGLLDLRRGPRMPAAEHADPARNPTIQTGLSNGFAYFRSCCPVCVCWPFAGTEKMPEMQRAQCCLRGTARGISMTNRYGVANRRGSSGACRRA